MGHRKTLSANRQQKERKAEKRKGKRGGREGEKKTVADTTITPSRGPIGSLWFSSFTDFRGTISHRHVHFLMFHFQFTDLRWSQKSRAVYGMHFPGKCFYMEEAERSVEFSLSRAGLEQAGCGAWGGGSSGTWTGCRGLCCSETPVVPATGRKWQTLLFPRHEPNYSLTSYSLLESFQCCLIPLSE